MRHILYIIHVLNILCSKLAITVMQNVFSVQLSNPMCIQSNHMYMLSNLMHVLSNPVIMLNNPVCVKQLCVH